MFKWWSRKVMGLNFYSIVETGLTLGERRAIAVFAQSIVHSGAPGAVVDALLQAVAQAARADGKDPVTMMCGFIGEVQRQLEVRE